MHRPTYSNPPTAHSPPLHHPVPQHVSTVPMMRSPPPPAMQQHAPQPTYGSPYQPQASGSGAGGAGMYPGYGAFLNDPTAQMGFQVGKSAVMAGQEYVGNNFGRYVNVSALKHYFNVSNTYVLSKLFLVLFPWRHRPWSRRQAISPSGQDGYFLPPSEDINSPDMYIPVMAFVTYILLSTLLAGFHGAFHPELLGLTATTAFAIVIIEILALKLGCYLLSISNESQLLDLVAYSGYKFVGIIITLVLGESLNRGQGTGGWIGWAVFTYTFLANAFFLLRSLKYVLLPENAATDRNTVARAQRNRRTQFLFVYSYIVQLIFMWILSRQDSGAAGSSKNLGSASTGGGGKGKGKF
ncbi:MAG: hypothetical protein M1815_006228 [Lichina confinis]|nr:MAG: hypothetical protein M1815_006228 [Lichina confinis]